MRALRIDSARTLTLALMIVLAGLLWTASAAAVEIVGVKLDEQMRLDEQPLVLNGAGLRVKVFFKVYVIGLYLPEKAVTRQAILDRDGPRRVRIALVRDVSAEDFSAALMSGLKDNTTAEEFAAIEPRADQLRQAMLAAGEAKTGTVVDLDYRPASGTRLTIGGRPQGADLPGKDFNDALLRIWIGQHPAQGNLAEALLGRPQ